jgi:frataxin-like iron-binding protein CyaY
MKKHMISVMAVAVFVVSLAVTPAQAQNAGNLTVTIPFEFVAAGTTLPSGDYSVQRSFEGGHVVMKIRSKNDTKSIFVLTHSVEGRSIQNESKLVFNKYGNQMFLSQVWIASRSTGEEMLKTNRERNLQKEIARRSATPETITIAGRSN